LRSRIVTLVLGCLVALSAGSEPPRSQQLAGTEKTEFGAPSGTEGIRVGDVSVGIYGLTTAANGNLLLRSQISHRPTQFEGSARGDYRLTSFDSRRKYHVLSFISEISNICSQKAPKVVSGSRPGVLDFNLYPVSKPPYNSLRVYWQNISSKLSFSRIFHELESRVGSISALESGISRRLCDFRLMFDNKQGDGGDYNVDQSEPHHHPLWFEKPPQRFFVGAVLLVLCFGLVFWSDSRLYYGNGFHKKVSGWPSIAAVVAAVIIGCLGADLLVFGQAVPLREQSQKYYYHRPRTVSYSEHARMLS